MDANEFYIRKQSLLELLSNAISEVNEALVMLKVLELKADEPDRIALEELEVLLDHTCNTDEWADIEWEAVNPMAEAARQAAKK